MSALNFCRGILRAPACLFGREEGDFRCVAAMAFTARAFFETTITVWDNT